MKVERLSLANFRGFEQLELAFEPDINVIAGVNGAGKSSILQGLATLFSRALPEFTPSTARPVSFLDEDIYYGKTSLETSAIFVVEDQRCHIGIQRVQTADQEEGDNWNLLLEDVHTEHIRTGELEASSESSRQVLQDLRGHANQPQVIYFTPKRHLPGRPRSLPDVSAFEIANAYGYALQDREIELREFMHWFRVVESGVGGEKGQRVLDGMQAVVTSFVPEFSNLRIEEEPALRFAVNKNGTALALNQLSDGERGLLAIIFDLTRRLSIANPELDNPIADGKAVVLIDEIELHLHPKWQRQVLKRFTETFRNCQFIVTTHSPQVLGEVESRCVRFLVYEDGDIVAWTPQRARGLDSNQVLEELMDVKKRNAEIESALDVLFTEIDEEDFEAAKESIRNLQNVLGENDPELTRAQTLMAFLEGDE